MTKEPGAIDAAKWLRDAVSDAIHVDSESFDVDTVWALQIATHIEAQESKLEHALAEIDDHDAEIEAAAKAQRQMDEHARTLQSRLDKMTEDFVGRGELILALQGQRNRIVEERDAALGRLDTAREALCQIANGIPGPILHATEALQAIAVERQKT